MTPAERMQTVALLGQVEAMEQQADALKHFAAGVKASLTALLGAAAMAGGALEAATPPVPEPPKYYGSRKVVSRSDVMPEPAATAEPVAT